MLIPEYPCSLIPFDNRPMKVVYTAPTRAHHYQYAKALHAAGYLHAFVSGFPRISVRANTIELDGKLHRADFLQTIHIVGLMCKLPHRLNDWLGLVAKIEQDAACRKYVKECDLFLYYNGCGLNSSRYGKKKGVISIVEAVTSHVEYQEEILREEYTNLQLPWKPFFENDKKRRLEEYNEADYILLPSGFAKRSFISKGFKEEKLLKVPYGFNRLVNAAQSTSNKSDHFTVLYVGAVSVRKGTRYLMEAFHKLRHPKKRLIIVGSYEQEEALKGISLSADITFTGVLKGEQLEDAYRSADVFCLPSIEDGFGLVLGEALSFGLPLIATVNTGAEEIITADREGFILPIRRSDLICEKLQLLADNPEMLETMSRASKEKASQLEGWTETGNKLTSILNDVYKKKSAG